METRFRALRIIGVLFRFLGVLTGVLALIAVFGSFGMRMFGGAGMGGMGSMGGLFGGMGIGLFALLYWSAAAVTLYAMGEGVDLLLALEENTRKAVEALEDRGPAGRGGTE